MIRGWGAQGRRDYKCGSGFDIRRADAGSDAKSGQRANAGMSPDSDQLTVLTSRLSLDEQPEATYVPIVGQPASAKETVLVPGYRVLHEIARGGMGRILAARDLSLDRDVALKILLPGASTHRFVRESKITARLPHPESHQSTRWAHWLMVLRFSQ